MNCATIFFSYLFLANPRTCREEENAAAMAMSGELVGYDKT